MFVSYLVRQIVATNQTVFLSQCPEDDRVGNKKREIKLRDSHCKKMYIIFTLGTSRSHC